MYVYACFGILDKGSCDVLLIPAVPAEKHLRSGPRRALLAREVSRLESEHGGVMQWLDSQWSSTEADVLRALHEDIQIKHYVEEEVRLDFLLPTFFFFCGKIMHSGTVDHPVLLRGTLFWMRICGVNRTLSHCTRCCLMPSRRNLLRVRFSCP